MVLLKFVLEGKTVGGGRRGRGRGGRGGTRDRKGYIYKREKKEDTETDKERMRGKNTIP